MAYKQAFSNVNEILADFVMTLCYDEVAISNYENWECIYPDSSIEDKRQWIIDNRRATIASVGVPDNKWIKNYPIEATNAILEELTDPNDSARFIIKLKDIIYDKDTFSISIKGHNGIFYNNDNLDNLHEMEFYVDMEQNAVILKKSTIKLTDDEKVYFLLSYQSYSTEASVWYVDFKYPKLNSKQLNNYSYFEWTFGKKLDDDYNVINDKTTPEVFRCFWHTFATNRKEVLDWLPLEYFMSWTDNAVSFVVCEDPISDINKVIHSFNYIGAIDSIKGAEYDDIESNFGSCGSYDVTMRDSMADVSDKLKNNLRASITFIEKHYDGYFVDKGLDKVLLRMDNVNYSNYICDTLPDSEEILITPEFAQYTVGEDSIMEGSSLISRTSPIGTTMNLHRVTRSVPRFKFTVNSGSQYTIDSGGLIVNITTLKEGKAIPQNTVQGTLYKDTLVTVLDDVNVKNMDDNSTAILKKGTVIKLKDTFTAPMNTAMTCPVGTSFILLQAADGVLLGHLYTLLSAVNIVMDYVWLNQGAVLQIKETVPCIDSNHVDYELYNSDIVTLTQQVKVDVSYGVDYTVYVNYREPFLGDMHYKFISQWYTGSYSSPINNFSPATALITGVPLRDELKLPNSVYEEKIMIPSTTTEVSYSGKGAIKPTLSYTQADGSGRHKVAVTVPHIITNENSGESWRFKQLITNSPVIETDERKVTNICTYPQQKYVTNFIYKKRGHNRLLLPLSGMDIGRIVYFVIDGSRKVVVNYSGTNVYKNCTITRRSDRGLLIEVDIDNPVDEYLYVAMCTFGSGGNYWGYGHMYFYFAGSMNIGTYYAYNNYNEQLTHITSRTERIYTYDGGYGPEYTSTRYFFNSLYWDKSGYCYNAGETLPNTYNIATINLASEDNPFSLNVTGLTNMWHSWV